MYPVKSVSVVGFGPVGSAIALALQALGMRVTVISDKLPGEGGTGDMAAGIGVYYKPSSPQIARFVLDSYESWMSLAGDHNCPAVSRTRLISFGMRDTPTWAGQVRDFNRLDDEKTEYLTYCFDPVALGKWRYKLFTDRGGEVLPRSLKVDEINKLRRGHSIAQTDYTIITMGLNLRTMFPGVQMWGARGVLVKFKGNQRELHSFDHRSKLLYVVNRPDQLVLGGTYDEFVETCSEQEKLEIGQRIVDECNAEFSLRLRFQDHTDITFGSRPVASGGAILKLNSNSAVGIVNGLAGQGWTSGPRLGEYVAERVREILL